ncbi:MAG: AI-2E family transporter [Gammaproteobacteria bacterium]|nr:AI-2E family transporter [Gammaproteobacteria bacterium]
MQKSSNFVWKKTVTITGLVILVALTFYLLGSILMPFAAGALLAYLSNPLVDFLMRRGFSRAASVILVFVALFGFLLISVLLLIPILQEQIEHLTVIIPQMLTYLQTQALPSLLNFFGFKNLAAYDVKKIIGDNIMSTGNVASLVIKTTLESGKALFGLITNILLIPVVTFYLLRDWDLLLNNIRLMIPKRTRPKAIKIAQECDDVLSGFFRGQLLVMLALAAIYSIGLSLAGLQIGIIIGTVTGLLSIVPYLGAIIGFVIAVIAALVQFGTIESVGWVILVFMVGQTIENTFLTPVLVGDRIGMHPVAVIFAVLAGGVLFGFFGVLMALPVAAVIMVLLRHLNRRYHRSELYQA